MKKIMTVIKICGLAGALGLASFNVSAYEIKHGYSADDGMAYYGVCADGKDLMVIEAKDGSYKYEGPASKGKMKKGSDLDKVARKACGEDKKSN